MTITDKLVVGIVMILIFGTVGYKTVDLILEGRAWKVSTAIELEVIKKDMKEMKVDLKALGVDMDKLLNRIPAK